MSKYPKGFYQKYVGLAIWQANKFTGYEAWIISSSLDGLKSVGLKPAKKIITSQRKKSISAEPKSGWSKTRPANKVTARPE